MTPIAAVQRAHSYRARCGSTGITPASPCPHHLPEAPPPPKSPPPPENESDEDHPPPLPNPPPQPG